MQYTSDWKSFSSTGKAVQIVCKDLFNHNFYLSSNEQMMAEGVQPQPCDNHLYVLPLVRTNADYKQLQEASETEREAKQ